MVDDKIWDSPRTNLRPDDHQPTNINTLEPVRSEHPFGTALANTIDELQNGRAEMIRATGAVLIASVLLYFCLARLKC